MNRILTSLLAALACGAAPAFAQTAPPAPPTPPPGRMLDAWPFSGTNYLSIRQDMPLSLTNVALVPTWAGNGLQVDSTNAATITYAVISTNGHTNIDLSQGTVEMWFSPDWNSADGIGNWGTLLEAGTWDANLATGAWGLYISPDASNIYFSAQSGGASTNYLNAPISWNAGEWHHIAVTYSATNTALYLEGQLAASGPGVSVIPGTNALANGFSVGSDGNGTGLLQSRGVFDELLTYNYQLSADTISEDYADDSEVVFPLPSSGFQTFTMSGMDSPSAPPGGGTGAGSSSPSFVSPVYGSNDFWIQPAGIDTNGMLTLIVHATTNTLTYSPVYELLWADSAVPPIQWSVWETFLGATNTNVTVLHVPIYTNLSTVFFEAVNLGTNGDSAGIGIPDSWQREYFGYVGIDPYGDPMGDGYSNLYKYQHGMNPNTYYPPAGPAVSAILNTNGNAVVSWPAAANLPSYGAGAVTGYTLQLVNPYLDGNYNPDLVTNTVTLGSNQLSYTNQLNSDYTLSFDIQFPTGGATPTCALQVNYANGNSQWSQLVPSFDPTCTVNAAVVRGPQGALYLAVSALPPNVGAIRIASSTSGLYYPINSYGSPGGPSFGDDQYFGANIVSDGTNWISAYFDVPVSSISNGLYQIPPSQAPFFTEFSLQAMGIGTNGNLGTPFQASPPYDWGNWYVSFCVGSLNFNAPFMDGRTNIAQNINLLLRGADWQNPFNLSLFQPDGYNDGGYTFDAGLSQPTNYVWDGFSQISYGGEWTWTPIYQRNEFQPFEETTMFTNLIFNLDLFDSAGNLTNALAMNENNSGEPDLMDSSKMFDAYAFATNNQSLPLAPLPAPVLNQNAQNWIVSQQGQYEVFSPFQYYVGCLLWNGDGSWTLPIGTKNIYGLPILSIQYFGTNSAWDTVGQGTPFTMSNWTFFQYVSPPVLSPAGYYFARPQIDPTPGMGNFALTNTTEPLFIIPFGQQFYLTAWAKQSVLNGYSGVYAYPQQYFDKAYLSDGNGNITTNETGILSEYGDFFPIEPGKVFLTTKADTATGSVGTNVVNVIKLQLDVNHDGTMDTSFTGPDNTTADRPFIFWVNNDRDKSGGPSDPGNDIETDMNHCDSTLLNIPSQRDLEDWARLWIVGLSELPTNCQATLSWNVIYGNPAINLAQAVDTNGSISYLTNSEIAAQQAGGSGAFIPSYKFASVTPSNSYSFAPLYLSNGLTNCFLFEGAGTGKGELVLTISQNGTNIASTSAFLDLHDVKDLYEQAIITNTLPVELGNYGTLSNWVSGIKRISPSLVSDSYEDTNVIVYIHGAANNDIEAAMRADAVFKRLYWAGYHGKFAAVHWQSPTFSTIVQLYGLQWFNFTDFIGLKSAPALKSYLNGVRERWPNYRLNLFAHSAGGIPTSEAIEMGAPYDALVVSQVAVSASCYDVNAPTNAALQSFEYGGGITPDWQPMGYHGVYTNWMTGRNINYFNAGDSLMATWAYNQKYNKPPGSSYWYDGTNSYNGQGHYLVSDPQESRAMVSRSRSLAIGAQGPSTGQSTQGVISGAIDLSARFQIGNSRGEHSAFFIRPIQTIRPYYQQILQDFQIIPAP